jgi:hypothetical protein
MPIGYRAEYLLNLAKKFINNDEITKIENEIFDYDTAFNIIKRLRGFGLYASTHLMVLCGYYQKIPTDSIIISKQNNYRNLNNLNKILNKKYKKWGDYKWWGLKMEKILKNENWIGD